MIREVTETLIDVVKTATPDLQDWVVAGSLHEDTLAAGKLTVCLYAVEESAHMRNTAPFWDGEKYRRAPLHLRLHYVVAYMSNASTNRHLDTQARLDRVVQVFHTTPIISSSQLNPALAAAVDEVTVQLWTPTSEERNQIWTAFSRPLQLALYYTVDAVPVDLLDAEGAGRVETHELRYGLVPS